MRPLPLALALALALLVLAMTSSPATVAEPRRARLVLVVHAGNKIARIDRSSLRNIYLGLTTFWPDDARVKPYHRAHDGVAGKPFFRDVLGMTPARYRHTWQKRQLSGQGVEPEVVATAAGLVASIRVKILAPVVAILVLLFVTLSVYSTWFASDDARINLKTKATGESQLAAYALSKPLAYRDLEQIKPILSGLASDPDVRAVAVYDAEGAFLDGTRADTRRIALDDLRKLPVQESDNHLLVVREVFDKDRDEVTGKETVSRVGALWIDFSSERALERVTDSWIRYTVIAGLGVLAAMLLLAWALSRLFAPIRDLTRVTSEIVRGDLTQTIRVRSSRPRSSRRRRPRPSSRWPSAPTRSAARASTARASPWSPARSAAWPINPSSPPTASATSSRTSARRSARRSRSPRRARRSYATGTVKKKVVPSPSWLSTRSRPPWASTMPLLM